MFRIRKLFTDVIRLLIILVIIIAAITVGVGLFAVGVPLVTLLIVGMALSVLGFYIDPEFDSPFKMSIRKR